MFNKILLAAIAAGGWANAVATFVVRPAHADAAAAADDVRAIRDDFHKIENGSCENKGG